MNWAGFLASWRRKWRGRIGRRRKERRRRRRRKRSKGLSVRICKNISGPFTGS